MFDISIWKKNKNTHAHYIKWEKNHMEKYYNAIEIDTLEYFVYGWRIGCVKYFAWGWSITNETERWGWEWETGNAVYPSTIRLFVWHSHKRRRDSIILLLCNFKMHLCSSFPLHTLPTAEQVETAIGRMKREKGVVAFLIMFQKYARPKIAVSIYIRW